MNNAALKALIDEVGNRLFLIHINNGRKILLGVMAEDTKRAKTLDNELRMPACATDIQYKTVGGTDMFGIHIVDNTWGVEVPYTHWWITGFIEGFMVTDELGDYIPNVQFMR